MSGTGPRRPWPACVLGAGGARTTLGPDPAVQQITSAAGGVVALILSHGSAGLPDIGDVLFVPVSASGIGTPRIIARANYMALAPNRRDIWVEQAGPPWGNGPAGSPAWLVDEDGRRLSGARGLNSRVLVAATVRGLLVQGPDQKLALVDPVNGSAGGTGIPENAIIAGADADHVAWQAASCETRCPLHVTDLRGGPGTQIALPPDTVIDPNDTSDFDPAGQRLALALDTVDHQGAVTGTYVYVADLSARKLIRVPGGPIPVAALPAVAGAFPAGSSDVVSRALGRGWLGTVDRGHRRALLPGGLLGRPRPAPGAPAAGRAGVQVRCPGDRHARVEIGDYHWTMNDHRINADNIDYDVVMAKRAATPVRFDPPVVERLASFVASNPGMSLSSAANRLVDEALRMSEHPGIVFRAGPTGRRASLASGPDVWEAVRAIKSARTAEPA